MPSNIIAISGLAGSGKNTVGREVAKLLGWRIVEPTFKDLAAREGISLEQFQKKAAADFEIDKKFDLELKLQCEGENCVVSTWLGPWMADGAFTVWLDVPLEIRAKRVAGREGILEGKAKASISERDEQNRQRYLKVYGININNHSGFDLILDASRLTPAVLAKKIVQAYKKR